MNIFQKLFSSKKNDATLDNIITIKRIPCDEFQVNINESIKIWNKPDTEEIFLFAPGSVAGRGKIGTFNNKLISEHLRKDGLYKAIIYNLTTKEIELKVELIQEFKTIEVYRKEQNTRYIEQLKKSFNPKVPWNLRFIFEQNLTDKKNLKVGCNDLETTVSNIDKFHDNIWITDKLDRKIKAQNTSDSNDILKTLRALYSGHELMLIHKKKIGVYDFFEVKIKTAT